MMETVLGLFNAERVSTDILDPLGVLTLYKRNKVKRDLGWPRKEKLVLKNFFFAIGRYNEKGRGMYVNFWESTFFQERDMRRKRNQQVS